MQMKSKLLVMVAIFLLTPMTGIEGAAGTTLKLDKSSRIAVDLTVYGQGKALVREVRKSVLPKGQVSIEFVDVPEGIDTGTVSVSGIKYPDELKLTEQHYHHTRLSRESLLARYIGRKIKYSRSVLEGTSFEKVLREGVLLAVNPEVVQFGDEIEIAPEGTISLSYIPEDLRSTPTLAWTLENKRVGEKEIETRYMTGGMSWHPDYTLMMDNKGEAFSLGAWVTIDNRTGASFENASIALVAGDLNIVAKSHAPQLRQAESFSAARADVAEQAQGIADYQLYQIPGFHDIKNYEALQIRFLDKGKMKLKQQLVLTHAVNNYPAEGSISQQVARQISFENDNKTGPGVPLPAGRVVVLQKDQQGHPRLVGENRISHIPVDETVSLEIGKSFDVVAERRQTSYRRNGNRGADIGQEIVIRNRSEKKVTVLVNERFHGDWNILEESQKGVKTSAFIKAYSVEVAPGKESRLIYTVRTKW